MINTFPDLFLLQAPDTLTDSGHKYTHRRLVHTPYTRRPEMKRSVHGELSWLWVVEAKHSHVTIQVSHMRYCKGFHKNGVYNFTTFQSRKQLYNYKCLSVRARRVDSGLLRRGEAQVSHILCDIVCVRVSTKLQFITLLLFNRESNSTITNVCLSMHG